MVKKSRKQRKFVIASICLALAIVAGAVVVGYFFFWQNKSETTLPTESGAVKTEAQLLDDLKSATTDKQKATVYMELSNASAQKAGGDKKAVEYAEQAVKVDPRVDTYGQVGFAAEEAGDYKKAFEAYDKALSLSSQTEDDKMNGRSNYNYYLLQKKLMEEQL